MLELLRIQNYALIDTLEIEFGPGFNVLSGETGAGKSILVGALNLVLGARAAGEMIRSGGERAQVEAAFRLPRLSRSLKTLLDRHDVPLEDSLLILSRALTPDGRSRGYAGGRLVPISVLAEIGDQLVDLHGQHEHQSLLRADCQLALLDGYAGLDARVAALGELVSRLHAHEREIEQLEQDDRDRTREMDFLRYEVQEITQAALEPGEEESLQDKISQITHAERIHVLALHAYSALYESDDRAGIDAVNMALRDLEELAAILPEFAALRAQLEEARVQLESVATELRRHTEEIEYSPDEVEALHQRRALIQDLKRKYGADIELVLDYCAKAKARLANYEHRDERLEALRAQVRALGAEARNEAQAVSAARKTAAQRLDKQVLRVLQNLGMKGARFASVLEETPLSAHGVDRLSFHLAANAGEELKPLRLVASGGEISRIMLALKSVFAEADTIGTLVFDEIDAGVGGATARNVGEQLQALSRSHQVICITHIAQIAARAQKHFSVRKTLKSGRTHTTVLGLSDETRAEEIARLLDGSVSPMSLEHARQLLTENTEENDG